MKEERSYAFESTILAIFNNEQLKTELEKWASANEVKIFWGDPSSPDIIAVPCFALIVDRNVIDKESYQSYLEYIKEIKETNVFIAFDDNNILELPKNEVVIKINPTNKNAIKWIIENINNAKKLK